MLKVTAKLIVDELKRRNIKHEVIDPSLSLIRIVTPQGSEFIRSSVPADSSAVGGDISNDKILSYKILSSISINMPSTACAGGAEENKSFMKLYKTIVVKPRQGAHGYGVSVNITDEFEMNKAIDYAKEFSQTREVLLQEQVDGVDVRVLVVGYEYAAASERMPAQVVGDGVSTIEQLIEIENKNPLRGHGHMIQLMKIDASAAKKFLGENIIRIPKLDENVVVSGAANISSGGKAHDVTDVVPQFIAKQAEQIAKLLGLPVCGIDFMTSDISDPSKYYCIEVNQTPGFNIHDAPTEGQSRQVASKFVDYIMEHR